MVFALLVWMGYVFVLLSPGLFKAGNYLLSVKCFLVFLHLQIQQLNGTYVEVLFKTPKGRITLCEE